VNARLLEVEGLSVHFGLFQALKGASFHLNRGETVGLVGESGAGKSTLARAVMRLVKAQGRLRFDGEDLLALAPERLRALRRDFQMVFQSPLGSLNPRLSVRAAVEEPLELFEPGLDRQGRARRVAEMLERVGLQAGVAARYPHEFSGGQCQRIAIARAMIARPKLLVCDEPVSSLDVSIQGQIVNLLKELQEEAHMAMLFISHNLAVVRQISHRIMVMQQGEIVESGERDRLLASPQHPCTQRLLLAVPHMP
jgi:ABC-type microcin C transport system duplicated ATPase subunit YejF